MQDPLEVSAALQMEHRVKVIRHHAPGVQVVSLTVEELKRTRDDRGIRVLAENAVAVAFVEIRIQFQTEKPIDLRAFSGSHRHPHHLLAFSKKRDCDVLRQ